MTLIWIGRSPQWCRWAADTNALGSPTRNSGASTNRKSHRSPTLPGCPFARQTALPASMSPPPWGKLDQAYTSTVQDCNLIVASHFLHNSRSFPPLNCDRPSRSWRRGLLRPATGLGRPHLARGRRAVGMVNSSKGRDCHRLRLALRRRAW